MNRVVHLEDGSDVRLRSDAGVAELHCASPDGVVVVGAGQFVLRDEQSFG